MLKGAIFDHDGLMFDTESIWQKNWHLAAEKRGVVLPDDWANHISGSSGQLMRDIIQEFYHVEDGTEIQKEVSQHVLDDEAEHIEAKAGLYEILEMFEKNGVKMAVASSSAKPMIERNLVNGKADQYFEAVISGTEVEHGKPAPDIFLKAADELGLDPKDCYVFEDAYNGVRAGHAAGCKTIMIPDMVQPDEEISKVADSICNTLTEACQRIETGEL